jgi:Tol biopolymer transport system component
VISFLDPTKGLGREITRVELRRDSYDLRLSPDGKRISLISDVNNQLRIINTADGSIKTLNLEAWGALQSASWSSVGTRIYVNGLRNGKWGIASVDMEGKVQVVTQALGPQAWIHSPVSSPDGRYLAYNQRDFESNVALLESF